MVSRSASIAHENPKESIMKLKNLLLATIAGTAAIISAPVFADGHRDHDRGWHGERREYYPRHHYYYAPPPLVYAPPPVVYPAPRYYGYAPGYYYPAPAPMYQAMPVSPDISIRFRLPL
jgi:hypothetical protein